MELVIVLGIAGILYVGWVCFLERAEGVARYWDWVFQTTDAPLRRLLVASLIPGIVIGVWLAGARSLQPPSALIVTFVVAGGLTFLASAAVGLDGAWFEPHSVAVLRQAEGRPPPSSVGGRVVCALLGLAMLGGSVWLLAWLG